MSLSRGLGVKTRSASPRVVPPMEKDADQVPTVQANLEQNGSEAQEPGSSSRASSVSRSRGGRSTRSSVGPSTPRESTPQQKLRLRVKQWEPLEEKAKKAANGETPRDGPRKQTPKRTADGGSTPRSENVKAEDIKEEGQPTHKRTLSNTSRVMPNSQTPEGKSLLRKVVNLAVKRARELENEPLALALQQMYEDSQNDKKLAQLLDNILTDNPSEAEAIDFQNRVKDLRKKFKRSLNAQHSPSPTKEPSTPASSQPPPSQPKSSQQSAKPKQTPRSSARRSNSQRPSRGTPSERPNTTTRSQAQVNGHTASNNNMSRMDPELPPAKRQKRSASESSTSSLSSVKSADIDEKTPAPAEPPSQVFEWFRKNRQNSEYPDAGLPHHFKVGRVLNDHPPSQRIEAIKGEMKRSFNDYSVSDVTIRRTPKRPRSSGSGNSTQEMNQASSQTSQSERSQRARTPKEGGKKTRLKNSPIKKHGDPKTVTAGRSARSLRDRDPPLREPPLSATTRSDAMDFEEGDNQDFCSTCGGNGTLMCCDGCVRSFHCLCNDPPKTEDDVPEGEWFCYDCEARRHPRARPRRGLFALLEHMIHKQNPVAFSLSESLQNHFEGVRAGEDGEYEEVAPTKNTRSTRSLPTTDEFRTERERNLQLKDSKGRVRLCYVCGESSTGTREMISCDYCSLKWHLDCLNPPLTSSPIREIKNGENDRDLWMCPAHFYPFRNSIGRGGRPHRIRRPKRAVVVDTQLTRGLQNMGQIEIENEEDSDQEIAWNEDENVIFRVTERSVKLDFIDRVRREVEFKERENLVRQAEVAEEARRVADLAHRSTVAFNNRKFVEKDVALTLAKMAGADPKFGVVRDSTQDIINSLIMNATPNVIQMLETGETVDKDDEPAVKAESGDGEPPAKKGKKLTNSQKQKYLLLMELINQRLEEAAEEEAAEGVTAEVQ